MAKATFRLPISDTVISSWQKINGVKTAFWINFAVLFVVIAIHNALINVTAGAHPAIIVGLSLIILIAYIMIKAGLYYLGIERAKGSNLTPASILKVVNPGTMLHLFGLVILQTIILIIPTLMIILGLELFVHPMQIVNLLGILLCLLGTVAFITVILRLSLSLGFVIDRNEGPATAIRHSYEVTKGNFWRLLGFYYMLIVLVAAGLLTMVVGIIWTLPLLFIAYGTMFQQLANKNL